MRAGNPEFEILDYVDIRMPHQCSCTCSIAGCETGIANSVDADGCMLADALATTCRAGTVGNAHGEFTAEVVHVNQVWRDAGLIDRGAAGRVVACAAGGKGPIQNLSKTGVDSRGL